jgi:predicted RNA-binding Zn-ribbon protein involved in translation (DUF1610 family)
MTDEMNGRAEVQDELEPEIQFACPHCGEALDPSDWPDANRIACPYCGETLSLASQRAMDRADAYYRFALSLTTRELMGGKRRPTHFSPQAKDALRAYQRAYTGVEVALQAQIPEEQKARAVEIMAETAQILQMYHMVSGLEARYWVQLMVCQTARDEYRAVRDKLDASTPGLLARLLQHPYWRLRVFQLKRALARREARLADLERDLGFIDKPTL